MDIKPPRRVRPVTPPSEPVSEPAMPTPAPRQTPPGSTGNIDLQTISPKPGLETKKSKPRWLKWLVICLISLAALTIVAGLIFWIWYQIELSPADAGSKELVPIKIESGASPGSIGDLLEEKQIIRSSTAFMIYTRLSGTQNSLQAGSYRLSPADNTARIVQHLTDGNVDTFRLTFFPGATLVDNTNKPDDQKTDVTTVLTRAGFDKSEISAALAEDYDHPLFQTKPATADLEGYIYGETYDFYSGSSVEDIFIKIFDHFYEVIQQNDLINKFKARDLTLYQGITLGSIIQRESGGDDKAQIAQVFLKRLSINMVLGSDVTYQYIADKTGVPRDTNLDSLYNTRRYPGLPPGPIAVPGLASLLAVAGPASGDYLYFLSGDDDITYFARTLEEHERNITEHCQQKCQIL